MSPCLFVGLCGCGSLDFISISPLRRYDDSCSNDILLQGFRVFFRVCVSWFWSVSVVTIVLMVAFKCLYPSFNECTPFPSVLHVWQNIYSSLAHSNLVFRASQGPN